MSLNIPSSYLALLISFSNKLYTQEIHTLEDMMNASKKHPEKLICSFENSSQLQIDNGILNLSNRNIVYLLASNEFFDILKWITGMNLSFNSFETVHKSLFNNTFLQKELVLLDLSHNQIKTFPKEIGHLCNLQDLDLSWNQLAHIPHSFSKLISLRSLDVQNNLLSSIPLLVLSRLDRLTRLNISNNCFNILDLKSNKLDFLDSLESLALTQVASVLKENPHYFCESKEKDTHSCSYIPWNVTLALSQSEFVCDVCFKSIYPSSNSNQNQRYVQVITKCNQPVIAESLFCSKACKVKFISSPRTLQGQF